MFERYVQLVCRQSVNGADKAAAVHVLALMLTCEQFVTQKSYNNIIETEKTIFSVAIALCHIPLLLSKHIKNSSLSHTVGLGDIWFLHLINMATTGKMEVYIYVLF